MKKLLLIIAITLTTNFCFAQEAKITSVVTAAEYKSMNDLEKRLTDYVDASIASLKGLKLNDSKAYSNYQASISISQNANDKLNNNIAIGDSEAPPVNNAQSCTICGLGSARICFKRIMTILSNGQPLVITTILTTGDCVQLTWN